METEFERLRKKVENYPSASAYNRLAELARLNGNMPDAEHICLRCIKEFPRNGQAYVILAEIALGNGRRTDAIKHLETAVDRDSRSYSGHRMLADLFVETGEAERALRHLKAILSFKPNDPPVVLKIDQLSKAGTLTPTRLAATPAALTSTPTERVRTMPNAAPKRDAALVALIGENGVRGAVIADAQGRVVMSQGLGADKADFLAALVAEITASQLAALKELGHDQIASWVIEAERGQVLAFKRDAALTVAVLAAPGVRAALLELRARQALLDVGAG